MAKTLSPMERVRIKIEEDAERSKRLKQFCYDQGLCLVQLSPRRYMVVRFGRSWGVSNRSRLVAYMGGEIAFGPAHYERCMNWLEDNAEHIPNDCLADSLKKQRQQNDLKK